MSKISKHLLKYLQLDKNKTQPLMIALVNYVNVDSKECENIYTEFKNCDIKNIRSQSPIKGSVGLFFGEGDLASVIKLEKLKFVSDICKNGGSEMIDLCD
jgi:hypothetical protein